jgi:succinate dehydrogenase / fumarate reductase cytochrome b subunit
MAARPLSPHLTVYRFAYTMALSILHRITGLALAAGLVLLVGWLHALAAGEAAYAQFTAVAGHGLAQVVMAAWLLAFVYHFANGIRHLCWDAGYGLNKVQARRSALWVVLFVVVLTLALLYGFFVAAGQS